MTYWKMNLVQLSLQGKEHIIELPAPLARREVLEQLSTPGRLDFVIDESIDRSLMFFTAHVLPPRIEVA
jgi:hypothetical protein